MKILGKGKIASVVLTGGAILILISCSMDAHRERPVKEEVYVSTARAEVEINPDLQKILNQLKKWPEERPVVTVSRKREFRDYSVAYAESFAAMKDHSVIPVASPSDPKPLKKFVLFRSRERSEQKVVEVAAPKNEVQKPQFRVRTTAYTHTEADHLAYGRKNAIGTQLKYGSERSAASDWSRFPLGTRFIVKGQPDVSYIIDDYGSALVGTNTIDFYKPSKASMNQWGLRHVDIEILEWGCFDKSLQVLKPRTRWSHVRKMVNAIVANNRAMDELRMAPLILE